MATVSTCVTIRQPVEQVFSYVTAVENHTAWQASILDAKVTPAGPVAAGSIYHYGTQVMGRRMETQLQISAFELNKKWGLKTCGVPRPVETEYLFEQSGDSTVLTISMELSGGYPAAAEALVKQQMEKSLKDQGQRIKQLVEK